MSAALFPISNLGARVDLQLRTDSDFKTQITFTNADGTPVNLTGCALAAQLRKLPQDLEPVASFVVAILAPATGGLASLAMPAAVTALIPCGQSLMEEASRYAWDLQLIDATGAISAPLYGTVRIAAGVTR